MIFRFLVYFFVIILLNEILAFTAVSWSFFESANSSLNLLKYTSDNKARDILSTITRVAETKMSSYGYQDMNDFFYRLVKQSEKDLDKFTIQEIFLISNDGKILSHSNPAEVEEDLSKRKPSPRYNKSFFLKPPQRMKKGQNPIPRNFGKSFKGDSSFFSNIFLEYFPEIKNQTVIVSTPIYHQQTLEFLGSVHMIYNRGNFLFFLDRQKDIFIWMVINYLVIAMIVSVILWVIHIIFSLADIKDGIKEIHQPSESNTSPKLGFITSPTATITSILKNEIFYPGNSNPPQTKQLEILKEEPSNKREEIQTSVANSQPIEIPEDKEEKSKNTLDNSNSNNGKNSKDILDAIYLD